MTLTIGDYSRSGLMQITDTNWDYNGTLKVTVRELIGEPWDLNTRHGKNSIRRARHLAKQALMYPEKTRSAEVLRTWFAGGSTHVTFAVSRNRN